MAKKPGISIYVAATPYHYLLNVGIASFLDTNHEKYLFLISDFKDADLFFNKLVSWDKNPFKKVVFLGGRYGSRSIFGRLGVARANIRIISDFFNNLASEAFTSYVCNIEQPEGQLIASICKKRGGTVYYVEDGIGTYLQEYQKEPAYSSIIKKILYGTWYENASSYTTSHFVDYIMVLRPDILSKGEWKKEAIRIPADVLLNLRENGFIGLLLGAYGKAGPTQADAMLIVPNSKVAEMIGFEKTVDVYRRILEHLCNKGLRVMVKYHPREARQDYLCVSKFSCVHTAPQSIISEILYLTMAPNQKMLIIGDTSTALFNASLFLPKARSISMIDIFSLSECDAKTRKLFIELGIYLPKTFSDLISLLDKW